MNFARQSGRILWIFQKSGLWQTEGRLLSRDGKKSSQDDQEYRSNVRNNLIEEEVRPQYTTGSKRSQVVKDTISKDPRKNSDGEIDIKKVKFYRYKDRNYSLLRPEISKSIKTSKRG